MSITFLTGDHDPPDSDNIVLCAGPKERQALASWLLYRTPICNCHDFINGLHKMAQEQAKSIVQINERFGSSLLRLGDAYASFNQHLANMDQVDIDRVLRHLHVLLIDRYQDHTGISELDERLTLKERTRIFKDIIVPWVDWVRSAKQNKSDIVISNKSIDQIETDLLDADIVENIIADTDKKPDTTKDNIDITTNKKPSNNRKYTMFNKFEHDPPGCDDITICAGPKEKQALITILSRKTDISDIEDFIGELHDALDMQTISIWEINERFGSSLHEDDSAISFDRHLSDMCQEDVDKVMRHMRVILIDRCDDTTGVCQLDEYLSEEERTDIYNNIIEPWLEWVRSAKKNKSDTSKANTNKKPNTTKNNKPLNNNNTNMSNNTTNTNMFESLTSVFANMLGTLESDMIRMTFDGKVAVKTTKGYKTYDVDKKKAINMDSLVMPDMAAFLLLPSTKVKTGDIILRDGAFYSIISIDDATNELIGYNYEAGKKETIVRETHCFLGNTYFYSKLFSPILSFFGNKPKSDDKKEDGSKDTEASEDTMSALLPLAMMSQNGDMNSILPLMLMSKMEGKEDSGMLKMLMLSNMMGGSNSNMNNLLPLMLMSGNFPTI